ncbi:DUF2789 family protein [Candidatus Thalassolituus haligoni]|uniref:DUF2789 family protein n=1 Tax=Candidatus Thalassolituus haligoni TaxID=3100113 RepID=UPI003515289F
MHTPIHTLTDLFRQLGLPHSETEISTFIDRHKPIGQHSQLSELSFFTTSQQQFLSESLNEDADWSEVIDTLDTLLRQEPDIRPS